MFTLVGVVTVFALEPVNEFLVEFSIAPILIFGLLLGVIAALELVLILVFLFIISFKLFLLASLLVGD